MLFSPRLGNPWAYASHNQFSSSFHEYFFQVCLKASRRNWKVWMGKKRSWFGLVKRLFISEAKEKEEKKSKRWRWVFTRLRLRQCPALAAPRRTLSEAKDEQKKHAMTVALATAAAAEAAVAAAHAAAVVVRLTGTPQSYHTCDKGNQNLAAIKIQTAFRGHLARKALRALKGLVRLQALVRGQILRCQLITTLECLPSTANNQAQVNKRGVQTANESCKDSDNRKFLSPKELGGKEIKDYVIEQLEGSSKKSWDCSMLLKEDMEAKWFRKQEAVIKRERMKKYSSSHRERVNAQVAEETEPYKENGKWNSQFEQWIDAKESKREELENSKSTVHLNMLNGDKNGTTNVKLRNAWKRNSTEGSNLPFSHLRISFCHRERNSDADSRSFPSSPVFPTYMATTESTKAKARSMSMPKQRVGFRDSCFDHGSPNKNRLSFWSSVNGESIRNIGRNGTWQNSVTMKSFN